MKLKTIMILLIALVLMSSVSAELIVNKYSNDFTMSTPLIDRAKGCTCETLIDPIYVENTGNFVTNYKLSVLSDNNWFTLSEEEFTLQPFERKTVMLYSEIPCDSVGEIVYQVKAESSYGREKKITQNLDVVKCQNSLMTVTADKDVANLGEPVSYQVKVTNVGEFIEKYSLDFGSFNEYSTIIAENVNEDASFYLNPGEEKTLTVMMELPLSFYGDYEIPFKITSNKNKASDEKIMFLKIENQYDHSIKNLENLSICSGIEETSTFNVVNNINFENNFKLSSKGAGFVDFEPKTFHLLGNETKEIQLKLNPGKNLGDHDFKIIANSELGDIVKEQLINVNVRDCFNYQAGFPAVVKEETQLVNTFKETTCCGEKEYYLTIHNRGETKEAYDLIVNGPSWFSSETQIVNLKPNEMVTVPYTAKLPCTDEEYDIEVEVILKKHPEIRTSAFFDINSQTQRTCHLISVDEQKIVIDKETKIVPLIVENTAIEGGNYKLSVKSDLYEQVLEPEIILDSKEKKIIHLMTSDLNKYFTGNYKGSLNLTLTLNDFNNDSNASDSIVYSKSFVTKLKNKSFIQKALNAMNNTNFSKCLWSLIILTIILILVIIFLIMVIMGKALWFSNGLFSQSASLIAKVVLGLLLVLVIITLVLKPLPSKATLYEAPLQTDEQLVYQWNENENFAIDLNEYFADPDMDQLSFSSSTPKNVDVQIVDSVAMLKPEHNFAGVNEIVFTATDKEGGFTDSPVFTLIILEKKNLSLFDKIIRYCVQINYLLMALILLLALIAVSLAKPKKEKKEKLLPPVPPKTIAKKKPANTLKKTATKKKTTKKVVSGKRSAHSLAVDRALVSMDEHEVKSILKTKGKRATKSNIAIVQKAIRDFKASKSKKPKNRDNFYQYMKDNRINQRLRNKK